jgi:hypothetical protein
VRHRTALVLGATFVAVLGTTFLGACGDDGGGPDLADDPASSSTSTTTSSDAAATTSTTAVGITDPSTGSTTPPGTDLGEATLDGSSTVSTTGFDTVVFGMSIVQAEDAAGTRLLPDDTITAGVGCRAVSPEGGPPGVVFTVTAGTIERVDVRAPSTNTTRSGAGIGTTVAQLQTLYTDRLSAEGTSYVFTPRDAGDAAFRVIFETDGTTVTSFRAGRVPQVLTPTPC